MKIFFVLILIFSSSGWSRVCNMAEIKKNDLQRTGNAYSPFPMMTKVSLMTSLLPLIPRLDSLSQDNDSFWIVNLIGISGWFYNGSQTVEWDECEMNRNNDFFYSPRLNELIRYHEEQRALFWKNYLWNAGWMVAILTTTKYEERKVAALIALAAPWGFSSVKKWSPFDPTEQLELSFYPIPNHPTLGLSYSF